MLQDVLDFRRVQRKTPPLKVELKESPLKGVGIYAKAKIRTKELIALYRLKVFRIKTYESPTHGNYCFSVYTRAGNESKTFIADLAPESLQEPVKVDGVYVPYWAYFSNEPAPGQMTNSRIDTNLEGNYAHRRRVKEGDTILYKLVATKPICPGEEVVWYYGESYHGREYPVVKS